MHIEAMMLPIHVGATWFMTGLIWLIQLVHYPLLAAVGKEQFTAYERSHMRRITPIVLPAMTIELATGMWLAVAGPESLRTPAIVGAALLGIIWGSTFTLQAPMHRKLAGGYDEALVRKLVHTNWIRAAAWSARAILVTVMITPTA